MGPIRSSIAQASLANSRLDYFSRKKAWKGLEKGDEARRVQSSSCGTPIGPELQTKAELPLLLAYTRGQTNARLLMRVILEFRL